MSNQTKLNEVSDDAEEKSSKICEYKEVRIDPKKVKIPSDWDFKTVEEFSDKVTDGTHQTPEYVDKGVRFLSTKNLIPHSDEFDFSDYVKHISEEEHQQLIERCAPEKGDLLISKCGTIGRSQLIRNDLEFSIFVGLSLIKLQNSEINGTYLEEFVNWELIRKVLQSRSPGSTRKTLNIGSLEGLEVPLPPIDEQRRIASVLYNVDQAISKTEEIIEQTQRVKKGLMQDLFTEGYYKHKETKMTPIGEVPADWNLRNISEIGKIINGSTFPEEEQGESEGVPFIKISDTNKTDKYASHAENFITRNRADEINVRILPENSVILPKRGAAILTNKRRLLPQDSAIDNNQIGVYAEEINNTYLYHYLCTVDMERYAQKGAVASLNKSTLAKIKVPVPEKDEQKKIASSLDSLDMKISQLKKEKEQLQRLKKGLMQDLLTGKVRTSEDVKVLDEVVEVEG